MRVIHCVPLLLATTIVGGGCARQPSVPRAQALIEHHFVRYAKKYPTSIFGSSIADVKIDGIEELHKRYVAATATLALNDGHTEAVRCAIEHRPPLGWRIVSWERLE